MLKIISLTIPDGKNKKKGRKKLKRQDTITY